MKEVTTQGILHCDLFREFWVAFETDDNVRYIRFGNGGIAYTNTLLTYEDHDWAIVQGLEMGSGEQASNGQWEFSKYAGFCFK